VKGKLKILGNWCCRSFASLFHSLPNLAAILKIVAHIPSVGPWSMVTWFSSSWIYGFSLSGGRLKFRPDMFISVSVTCNSLREKLVASAWKNSKACEQPGGAEVKDILGIYNRFSKIWKGLFENSRHCNHPGTLRNLKSHSHAQVKSSWSIRPDKTLSFHL
jgi:hypothetical protein